jgi:hypothetical protein
MHYSDVPRAIQIETNLACNAECPFCPYVPHGARAEFMAIDLEEDRRRETRGLGIIYRPFLIQQTAVRKAFAADHPLLHQRRPTAKVEINTNAGLLNENARKRSWRRESTSCACSVDGFSRETYEPARGPASTTTLGAQRQLLHRAAAKPAGTRCTSRCG